MPQCPGQAKARAKAIVVAWSDTNLNLFFPYFFFSISLPPPPFPSKAFFTFSPMLSELNTCGVPELFGHGLNVVAERRMCRMLYICKDRAV